MGRLWAAAGCLAAAIGGGTAQAEPAAGTPWVEPNTGMEFVWVPSGCFEMGSNDGVESEQPVHRVCLKGFYMSKYEVTQAQFERVSGKNPSRFKGADRPVEQVTWDDAGEMAMKLGAKSGSELRLPSEAEWAYACRAGGRQASLCGADEPSGVAWYRANSQGQTHPVGAKQANAWGLYDMSGNVWEWTQDCWHVSYRDAPTDGSAWLSGGDCGSRVVRGGSWSSEARSTGAAKRSWESPGERYDVQGFRLVRTLSPESPAAALAASLRGG